MDNINKVLVVDHVESWYLPNLVKWRRQYFDFLIQRFKQIEDSKNKDYYVEINTIGHRFH